MRRLRIVCLMLALILSFVSCSEGESSESQTKRKTESSTITETKSQSTTVTSSETTPVTTVKANTTTTADKLYGNNLRNYTKRDIIEKIFHNSFDSFDFTGGQASYPAIENKRVCQFQFMFTSLESNWNRQLDTVADDSKPYMIRALSGAWINPRLQVGMKYGEIKKAFGIKGFNRMYCVAVEIDGVSWSVYFDLSEDDRNKILNKYEALTGKSKETFSDLDNTSLIDVSDIDPTSLHATYVADISDFSKAATTTTVSTTKPTTTTSKRTSVTTKATTKAVTTTKKQTPAFNENEMYAAYAALIEANYKENSYLGGCGYSVFDIDGNGIPELYIHHGGHSLTQLTFFYKFDLKTKKAVKNDIMLSDWLYYSKKQKCIMCNYGHSFTFNLYKFVKQNGKVVKLSVIDLDTGMNNYEQLVEKAKKDNQLVELEITGYSPDFISKNKLLSDLKANAAKNKQIMK